MYGENKLKKHLFTVLIILIGYIVYKLLSYPVVYVEKKISNRLMQANYKKLLSIMAFLFLFVFLAVRYMDDFLYIVTFLSVVAAALTIALREIILNIVGSVYIFFSNTLRVGDRIMVQFETKHTIGVF